MLTGKRSENFLERSSFYMEEIIRSRIPFGSVRSSSPRGAVIIRCGISASETPICDVRVYSCASAVSSNFWSAKYLSGVSRCYVLETRRLLAVFWLGTMLFHGASFFYITASIKWCVCFHKWSFNSYFRTWLYITFDHSMRTVDPSSCHLWFSELQLQSVTHLSW